MSTVAPTGETAFMQARQLQQAQQMKVVACEGKSVNVNADIRKFSEYIFKDGAAPGKEVVYMAG